MRRLCSLPERPGRAGPATEPSPRSPTGSAPASSATSTASTTPTPFRRLAGKCQVFIAPDDDHLRTRLTHAIEVAQVARRASPAPLGLNVALTAAAATGHDCGHGPAGHAVRGRALAVPRGRLPPRRLRRRCRPRPAQPVRRDARRHPQPLAGTARRRPRPRARSWRGPTASPTCCHDFEDAVAAGIVDARRPARRGARASCGSDRRTQLHRFITAMVDTIADTGRGGDCARAEADALAAFRAFNYERIYLRPERWPAGRRVVDLLQALVEHFVERPDQLPADGPTVAQGAPEALRGRASLRQRHDRPLRLPAGGRRARLGPSTAPEVERCPDGARRRSAQTRGSGCRRACGPCGWPNFTVPSARANSVSSPPRADVLAGVEAGAALAHDDRAGGDGVPSYTFTPRRWALESRPFRVEPPPLVFDMCASALRDAGDLDGGVVLAVAPALAAGWTCSCR